jgi:uncharacterized membrane protein YhhN
LFWKKIQKKISRFVGKIIILDTKLIANLFLFVVFLYASIGTLLSFGLEKKSWLFYTKPIIIPVLVLYYMLNAHQTYQIIIIALIFAFLGDFLLLWNKNKKFIRLGMLSYLAMHILFVIFMLKHQVHLSFENFQSIIMSVVYMLLGIIIFSILFRSLKNFTIPVIIYIVVLLSVSYICFFNVMERRTEVTFVQYLGSLLFIVSYTIFAFDNFRKPLRNSGIFIILTYIMAQIFLLSGFINT